MGKKDKVNVEKQDVVLEGTEAGQTTALAVAGGKEIATAFFPDLFNDIDFDGLSGAIDKIGDTSHELSVEEKEMGLSIVQEWNQSVIKRLRDKHYEMQGVVSFFNSSNAALNIGHLDLLDYGPELAEKTLTQAQFDKVLKAQDDIQAHQAAKPDAPIKTETTTYEEQLKAQSKYEGELGVWKLKGDRLSKQLSVATGAWKRALNESQSIKDLLSDARKYVRGASTLEQKAHDKGQMAKLSISISSKNAREALKELMKFTESI